MRDREEIRQPTDRTGGPASSKRTWTPPAVEELPRLTELTLQTGSSIGGSGLTGGGGGTVF